MMKLLRFGLLVSLMFLSIAMVSPQQRGNAAAMNSEIVWEAPRNISNSPESTSTDPFLLSDPTGKVHLFWAEKMSAIEGNQPDTLMYTVWDGKNWFKSTDIFFAPESDGTPIIAYPHAVIDSTGKIHLIWLAQPNFPNYTLFYSSAFAPDALLADNWSHQIALASDLTGTKYSIDIAFRAEQEIHVVYARVQQGSGAREERAVSYTRSLDGGISWSDPIDIASIKDTQSGASDTRILMDTDQRIYTTWTEWGESGLGEAIYFSKSLDNGDTWKPPIALSRKIGNEYERDWSNIQIIGNNHLVVMWEGGWRAYRQAQYSEDGGETWSKPIDTFPWLIGENGTVEFARDSNDQLHLFIAQRVREGYESRGDGNNAAIWHSQWRGDHYWTEPTQVTEAVNLINPKVVITAGNLAVATWYTQRDLEIMVSVGQISGAPRIIQSAWDRSEILDIPQQEAFEVTETPTMPSANSITPVPQDQVGLMDQAGGNDPTRPVAIGIVSVLFVAGLILLLRKWNH